MGVAGCLYADWVGRGLVAVGVAGAGSEGLAAELRPDGAWPIVVGVAGVGEDAGWL